MVAQHLSRIFAGLVRRTWLVGVTTILVCAAFAAHAVAALVEARYLDNLSPTAAPLVTQIPTAPITPPKPDGTAFVARNMFCSSCTPSLAIEAPDSANGYSPDAMLIAISIGKESFATVRVPASEVQGDWSVGDRIPGIGTVERIGFSTIDLRDASGRVGTLSLLPVSITGGRSDVGAATPDPAAAASPFADRIRKIDETTYEVDRHLVRDLVSGSVQTGGTRIIPVSKDGKLDGLKLSGVRPTSLAGSMGLANGDLLQAVNNQKIENANQLLELYAQIDKLDQVELSGMRRGKPLTLKLRLR